jgi:Asp/Glu/hydantoin racemase
MAPIMRAFASEWPEATVSHLLDEALTYDRAQSHELTEEVIRRFLRLAEYAYDRKPDGILATCSAFGPAIERVANALPIPVCKPNQPMFEAALTCGRRIAMIATFAPSVVTMEEEFREAAERLNPHATLTSYIVPDAMKALRAGDEATHNRLVAERAATLEGFDAIMLAHFSTSSALAAAQAKVSCPVFTAPESAVVQLRKRLTA